MTAFLNFLTGAAVGTIAIWVNKVIALFAGSNLSLRDWQHEADVTAAAFGTGVALVTAAIAVFVPKWLRLVLAVLLLGGSLYLGWRCIGLHELLATTPMAIPESDRLRAFWRLCYIGMLLSFVAALTCAAASMWSEKTPPDDAQQAAAPGTQPP
jgi:uncharacterized membrane-anchored protein YitT (DUF2179 family)